MQPMYYIGLDVHKRKISYCVKDSSGRIHAEGSISATRLDLDHWMKTLSQPWSAAMEATMFTGWIYDHLKPHAAGQATKVYSGRGSRHCYAIKCFGSKYHCQPCRCSRNRDSVQIALLCAAIERVDVRCRAGDRHQGIGLSRAPQASHILFGTKSTRRDCW